MMKLSKKIMEQVSIGAIYVNICLFFFGLHIESTELQILSLANISLFLLYFIIQNKNQSS